MRKILNFYGDQSEEESQSIPATSFFGNEAPEIRGLGLSAYTFDSMVAFDSVKVDRISSAIEESGGLTHGAAVNPGNLILGASHAEQGLGASHAEQGLGASSAGQAEITPIDNAFDAKGGIPGGAGGGGHGGGGSGGVLTSYVSGSVDGTAHYDIWIDFIGAGWTVNLQTAFKNAADYFTTKAITDDIGGDGLYQGKFIDDLYITAELKSIDGAGGILGQAGPTAVWTATELTAAGQMQFDVMDASNYLSQGLWDDIVTHEMMHVLGFGSLWNYGNNPLVSNNQYTGTNGLTAYQAAGHPNAAYIPVEDTGGSGTAGAHWDEQALTNELMTGYINTDNNPSTVTDNYLSKFSVMSLADLGYKVAYNDYTYDGLTIT